MTLLAELEQGGRARVVEVQGTDELSQRILEMGVLPGTEIKMIGRAPLGDPLEFELRGYRLSLRKAEAAKVRIERLG